MQILRAVVTSGSVTTAATNLGYTPSAISQQLAVLEREAGVPLLEKAGRGVRATEAGVLVAEQAGSIAKILADTTAELAALRTGASGRLRIRWCASGGDALIPRALTAYRARRPSMRIEPCLSAAPAREVQDGEADLAVLAAAPNDPAPTGLHLFPLLDDPFRAVLPADHALAEHELLDLAQLAEEPWVSMQAHAVPDACEQAVFDACSAAGFEPNVAVRTDDFLTAQGFVASGFGVRLASRLALRIAGGDGVAVRPVQRPEPSLCLSLAVRDSRASEPVITELLDDLHTAVEEFA
ncbi:LysR family transcriptional regulator [Allosaccharopolyspora coralli]|uniref:LysR family transcriptional regulator n=2 Tax=Allosaccharopolyspora coralli TaxID=2665642 RepID=A0A5Q3QCS4_9PSEU|nr:LysR family transcriptional regulator [Allosaccharopolyspora coralli]